MYKCSSDTEGVTIQWTVNGYSSTSSFITNKSIITEGAATQNSTLTIPGDLILNETTVICIGSGVVNGKGYFNTSSAVLYIQGILLFNIYFIEIISHQRVLTTLLHVQSMNKFVTTFKKHSYCFNKGPPAPPSITCYTIDQYNVNCNWTVPYTLFGVDISGYEMNITKREEILLQQNLLTGTEITYVRGNYNLSVAAVIGDWVITGEVRTIEVTSDESGEIIMFYN